MVESPLVSATIMVDFKKMQALLEEEEKDNDLIHARCAQCKRWHNLSSAKCFRSCVHAFSAALHARKMLGQIPVVLKLQRSTIYGSAQRLPQILHAFMVALNE